MNRETYDFGEIRSFRMAKCHSSIRFVQEIRDGFADNVTSPKNHGLLSFGLDFGFFQEDHDALGSAWDKIWRPAALG
jgi:hypothetical protein